MFMFRNCSFFRAKLPHHRTVNIFFKSPFFPILFFFPQGETVAYSWAALNGEFRSLLSAQRGEDLWQMGLSHKLAASGEICWTFSERSSIYLIREKKKKEKKKNLRRKQRLAACHSWHRAICHKPVADRSHHLCHHPGSNEIHVPRDAGIAAHVLSLTCRRVKEEKNKKGPVVLPQSCIPYVVPHRISG